MRKESFIFCAIKCIVKLLLVNLYMVVSSTLIGPLLFQMVKKIGIISLNVIGLAKHVQLSCHKPCTVKNIMLKFRIKHVGQPKLF